MIWGGRYERKGSWVGGVERWRWVEFFFEGDADDVDCIDDGHDGADCTTMTRMSISTMQASNTTTMMATETTMMAIMMKR